MDHKLEVRHKARKGKKETLAVLDGDAVRSRAWPKWPRADARTQRSLLEVLHSTQWTVSGHSECTSSYEQRFAQAFADFCGVPFGVSCANGTAALTIALQALDIGLGDEVIIPGLTWVACASAICNLGAVPVLADIDVNSLVMTKETARAAVTPQTKAILAVHFYSTLAPISELVELGCELGVPVIEDASQAHGALFQGVRAGASGTIGVFSMQQSKLLTAGEGGACVTRDASLYRRLIQLRADSRVYSDGANIAENINLGRKLVPCGEVLGRNLCMSEFHAAILFERLPMLDKENSHRHQNLQILAERLGEINGITLLADMSSEMPTYYRIPIYFIPEILRGVNINIVAQCLTAELNLPVEVCDPPLNRNILYQPMLSPLVSRQPSSSSFDPSQFPLPNANAIAKYCLTLPHWSLLGDESDISDIVTAFKKLLQNIPALQIKEAQ